MRRDGDGHRHYPECPGLTPPGDVTIQAETGHHEPAPPTAEGLNAQAAVAVASDAAPAKPKTRRNRKGATVAAERARACKVCLCTAETPCDMDAGRTCSWMDADTPPGGDLCSVCAEMIDLAEERIRGAGGVVYVGLTQSLWEDQDMPCLGDTFEAAFERLGKIVAVAVARVRADVANTGEAPSAELPLPSERPPPPPPARKERRPPVGTQVRIVDGAFAGRTGVVKDLPEKTTLIGIEVDRRPDERSPIVRQLLAANVSATDEDGNAVRGTCACGTVLGRENSARLPTGAVMHVGCPGLPSQELAILRVPCPPPSLDGRGGCGAAIGEPCVFAIAEPASWAHRERHQLLPAADALAANRRGLEDKARAIIDHYAGLAHNPPLPTDDVLVRALTEADARLTDDGARAIIDGLYLLGEVEHWQPAERDRAGAGLEYYRRKADCPPVVMGRAAWRAPEEAPAPAPAETDPRWRLRARVVLIGGPTSEHYVGHTGMVVRLAEPNARGPRVDVSLDGRGSIFCDVPIAELALAPEEASTQASEPAEELAACDCEEAPTEPTEGSLAPSEPPPDTVTAETADPTAPAGEEGDELDAALDALGDRLSDVLEDAKTLIARARGAANHREEVLAAYADAEEARRELELQRAEVTRLREELEAARTEHARAREVDQNAIITLDGDLQNERQTHATTRALLDQAVEGAERRRRAALAALEAAA